jgi:hypothetical protein
MRVWMRRGWWRLGVLVLLLAGCTSGGKTSGTASNTPAASLPTATLAPLVTPTFGGKPTPASLSPLGWKQTGAPVPDTVAIAPSAPGTIYTCTGATASGGPSNSISFSISTDAGATWRTMSTPIQAGVCDKMRVSPTDSQAIAIYASTCRGDCGQAEQFLYFTLDAGAHWTRVLSSSNQAGDIFAWVGTALFVNGAPPNTPAFKAQFLAFDINGGLFAWTSLPAAPQQVFSSGTTLYAVTSSSAACSASNGCFDLYTSTNRGATWTHLTPSYNGFNVRPLAVVPGSTTLLGFDSRVFDGSSSYPMLRSTNGGATWQALPIVGATAQSDTDPLPTPDGTIYCGFFDNSSGQGGIYTLAPGAASWSLVSPVVPMQINVTMVSWDSGGHPIALWGLVQVHPETSDSTTTLWTHAA